jgi:hypothetical protein
MFWDDWSVNTFLIFFEKFPENDDLAGAFDVAAGRA